MTDNPTPTLAISQGLTFKESCSDMRNSRVPAVFREAESFGVEETAHDPLADALILAVSHSALHQGAVERLVKSGGIVTDVKVCPDVRELRATGKRLWRL